MTKILPAFLLLVAVIGVLSTGAIAKAPKPPKAQPHPNSTTMTVVTVAANSCTDTPWATDTVKRNVKVHRLTTGATPIYRVKILDKGTFVTTGGVSPGNCPQNTSKHGTAVLAGKTGKVKGSMTGAVTGVFAPAGFNPATTCTAAAPCTTAELVVALFGAGAQFHVCRKQRGLQAELQVQGQGQGSGQPQVRP